MCRLRRFASAAFVLWTSLYWPWSVTALTDQDCAEIKESYNVIPDACKGSSEIPEAAVAQNTLSEDQRRNNIFFADGGAKLNKETEAQLTELVKVLQLPQMQNACLRLIGHTDSGGDASVNQLIGQTRAEVVGNALSTMLGNPSRIESMVSAGETQPLKNLAGSDIRQRRVEIRARHCPLR